MAFGFFKKTITADTIFHNGHIFTQDPELPWADAVAVKDEAILGVGNFSEMDAITGKDTCLIDLEGKFMFPGFIDAHRSPVLKVFQDQYLDLTDCPRFPLGQRNMRTRKSSLAMATAMI